jgi:methionyl-tRNA formyltransferase
VRTIFMGTPELACASLKALAEAKEVEVAAVVTQPDRPKGRDLKLQVSPVKELALRFGLPVMQPERARNEAFIEDLRHLNPELIAVAAYGQLLPKTLLELPRYGCLNVHTSLLPRYRGAAPIQWAILNGDAETGVTIMKMDVGLDTGDILTQERTPIRDDDTSETLHDRLAQIGAGLLVRTIPDYVAGKLVPRPQPAEGAVYAPKLKKEDGLIDWKQPARAIWNRVRGLMPWPGACTILPGAGPRRLLKVWEAEVSEGSGAPGQVLKADKNGIVVACGVGALKIGKLQLEGGRRLSVQEFLAGHDLMPGAVLG